MYAHIVEGGQLWGMSGARWVADGRDELRGAFKSSLFLRCLYKWKWKWKIREIPPSNQRPCSGLNHIYHHTYSWLLHQRCCLLFLDLTPATIVGDSGKKLYAYLAVGRCHLALTCGEGILKVNRWKLWGAAGITFTCDTAMKCQSLTDSSCSLTFTYKPSQITEGIHSCAHMHACTHTHTHAHAHTHTHTHTNTRTRTQKTHKA